MNRITNDFDDTTTAMQVMDGLDLTGRRAIVTGAASGIGVETARALAHGGAQVTLAVRDVEAGERAESRHRLHQRPGRHPRGSDLDLADLPERGRVRARMAGAASTSSSTTQA